MASTLMPNGPSGRLTYEQYCALPHDGKQYQLVDGELFVAPAPSLHHQRVVLRLLRALDDHVRAHRLGEVFVAPVDVLLTPRTVLQPDIVFVSTARAGVLTPKVIAGAPDLVVEVLSESCRGVDERTKLAAYRAHDVAECWYVDPELERIRLYRMDGPANQPTSEFSLDRDHAFTSALLPGLEIQLAVLFWHGESGRG